MSLFSVVMVGSVCENCGCQLLFLRSLSAVGIEIDSFVVSCMSVSEGRRS